MQGVLGGGKIESYHINNNTSYVNKAGREFIRDLMDGYFPSELQVRSCLKHFLLDSLGYRVTILQG